MNDRDVAWRVTHVDTYVTRVTPVGNHYYNSETHTHLYYCLYLLSTKFNLVVFALWVGGWGGFGCIVWPRVDCTVSDAHCTCISRPRIQYRTSDNLGVFVDFVNMHVCLVCAINHTERVLESTVRCVFSKRKNSSANMLSNVCIKSVLSIRFRTILLFYGNIYTYFLAYTHAIWHIHAFG